MAEGRQLDQSFLNQLSADGFLQIGRFEISGVTFNFRIETEEARHWLASVYAWVSVVDGGTTLRIGKCVGRLESRLNAYKRSLDDVMSARLSPNEHFKGDTQPWEREGWLHFAGFPGAGWIFAQQVPEKKSLDSVGRAFIKQYDPPLCGDSASGRGRKSVWIAQHGRTVAIGKRG